MEQKIKILLLIMIIFSTSLYAQRQRRNPATVRVCGEYTYVVPENISREQARRIAVERAREQALLDRFGRNVTVSTATVVRNENEQSSIRLLSLGGSEAKGEWLEDVGAPKFEEFMERGELVVRVSNVCGNAVEIADAGIDFMAKTLRNGTNLSDESNDFRDGNSIYLWFRSPRDGYLAVYLVDDDIETAYCLLPYMNDNTGRGAKKIRGGKDYILFSKEHAEPYEISTMDEYILTAKKAIEHNHLFIIFSLNEFTKANDAPANEALLPRQLPYDDFRRWLARNRAWNNGLSYQTKLLTIRK